MANPRVYLDNSATSFPKPPAVYEAMMRYAREVGASPGRGHYAESREGAFLIQRTRERINRLIGGESAEHVVFTLNTSDALNLAIKGVLRGGVLRGGVVRGASRGGRVHAVASAMDHNSVLRPLNALAREGLVEWTRVPACPRTGRVDPRAVVDALREDTALVALVHASNVAGTIQELGVVGRACRERGVVFLVDAAQSLGHVPLSVVDESIDLLAFPGHKGLLGPQGTGGLYVRPGIVGRVATTREGGTGHLSELDEQPGTMPQRFEAGSHNTAGIVGLGEGVAYLLERGVEEVRRHELELIGQALAELGRHGALVEGSSSAGGAMRGLRLLGPGEPAARVGVFSFTHEQASPAEVAMILEEEFGVLGRSGILCAPHAHATLGSADGGAVRLSVGPFTTREQWGYALESLRRVCEGLRTPTIVTPAGSRASREGS